MSLQVFFLSFIGSSPLYADFMIWPWLERIKYVKLYHGFVLAETLENVAGYLERMEQIPAMAECLIEASDHHRFYESMISGEPEYDFRE
jgi:hypothetical protein